MDIWPLFKDLTRRDILVGQHGLGGYLFATSPESRSVFTEMQYLQTNLLNELYLRELLKIQQIAHARGHQCIPVKGAFLLQNLYDDLGMRKMSDVDVLTGQLLPLRDLFLAEGYQEVDQTDYKLSVSKMIDGNEVVFELHSRLYSDPKIELKYDGSGLALQEHFYYLVYHLSYQHTFLRMNWFVDVALFLQRFPHIGLGILELAQVRGHSRAFRLTFQFLSRLFNVHGPSVPELPISSWYPLSFFLDPKAHPVKYYVLKHMTKDGLVEALGYDLRWLLRRARQKFHRSAGQDSR